MTLPRNGGTSEPKKCGKRILEAGFGWASFALSYGGNHDYHGFDIEYKKGADYSKVKGNLILHDGNQLFPYESNIFDVVYSSHVLEHIVNQGLFLSEIHRVLTNNGIFLISVPNSNSPNTIPFHFLRKYDYWWARIVAWSDPFHVCEFTRESIVEILVEYRFRIEECTTEGVNLLPTCYLNNRFRNFIGHDMFRALGNLFPERLRANINIVATV